MKNEFLLSPAFCLYNKVVVLSQSSECIVFGLVQKNNDVCDRLIRSVKLFFGTTCPRIEFSVLALSEFTKKVSSVFKSDERPTSLIRTESESSSEQAENVAAALLDSLLANACDMNATDIHIEGLCVRFRISGILREHEKLDKTIAVSLIRRIKVLANLNVAECRKPQDGQFAFYGLNHHPVYVRVSCVPAVKKEKTEAEESVVLRLLDVQRMPLALSALGFKPRQLAAVQQMCSIPFGLVLICGATGSGKSTTAGAMLEYMHAKSDGTKKLVSIEDPPEYVLPGVTQIAVRTDTGFDFSDVLRSVFRQDPDVIMIGEVRDEATAQTAVQAALTGHLVLATLHTATASQAVMRLCELSVTRSVVQAVLRGVIVQRLEAGVLAATVRRYRQTYCHLQERA